MKITVEISKLFTGRTDNLKAASNIILEDGDGERLIIKNVRVVKGEHGLFMSLPSRRNVNGEYKEMCYPLSATLRKRMSEAVLSAYDYELQKTAENPDDIPSA
ncbi:SpoVG family protein [Fumia xinanensis]|uniref:Septation protein SpoVG family protein n=1 Tax=Fumia xinanensis TaxID=2763659 RepID=A0A926I7A1_9FIRM|nr:SpoVG family protein [Fumia xinanensis]MBC8560760.1 septation protein SpoVG family protein [Fumia xinanensis]